MNAPVATPLKADASPNDSSVSTKLSQPGSPERVLFFVPFGEWEVHNQVDAVLAAALRLRGADIRMVRCDGIYAACDVLAWSGPLAKETCKRCAAHSSELFATHGLPVAQMRTYLTPEDFAAIDRWSESVPVSSYAAAEWNGLPMGKWVTSSVFSYFCITHHGLARPEVQAVHRRFLETGALTWLALSRMMDDYRPTRCVIFNARMAAFRVAQELSKQRGIPLLTHERGPVDDSFVFYENHNCLSTQPLYDCVDRWKDIPLTRSECLAARDYLMTREGGKGMNYPSFYSYRTDYAAVRRALRIPKEAKALLVLTSSEFELATSEHHQDATRQIEVLDRLIAVFRDRPEFLVVRHHPNIAGSKTFPADYDFLTRACRQAGSAPPNVRIVLPSESLSSYALFWNVDACVAFFSSAGVEATARGLATASFRDAFFQQAMSRAIADGSLEDLQALVDDLFRQSEGFGPPDLRRTYRFLNAYTRQLPKRFNSFGIKNHFERDLRYSALEELAPGRDKELDVVCEHLLSGASLWRTPSAQDQERDAREENEFLEEQLAKLLEQRARTQRQSAQFLEWRLSPTVAILRVGWDDGNPCPDFTAWAARPCRHSQLREYECQVAAPARHPEVIRATLSGLQTVREDYVLITWPSFWHDESLISSAVDELLDDAELAIDGILFGAWLVSDDNAIAGEIFTERVPAATYEEAITLLPILRQPLFHLPFGLFRKSKLLPLLEEINQLSDAEAASRRLFIALRGGSFHSRLLPKLALTQPKEIAPHARHASFVSELQPA